MLNLNDSVISVSNFVIGSLNEKLIGPIAVNQSMPNPIELLILFPSARACLSLIFKYYKFNRSKNIFINKWSPFCIQSLTTYYSNITTNISDSDLVLLNHRYGKNQFLKKTIKTK